MVKGAWFRTVAADTYRLKTLERQPSGVSEGWAENRCSASYYGSVELAIPGPLANDQVRFWELRRHSKAPAVGFQSALRFFEFDLC